MSDWQPTPGVHENFAAKLSPELAAHPAHEEGLEAAAQAALGHDHLLEVMMDLPEFKDMFSQSLKAYLSTSGLALTPAPVTHMRGDIYLVSALVERPGEIGHRAQVARFGSKEEAIGSSLELWQTDGWSVTSYDCTRCDKLMGDPAPVSNLLGGNQISNLAIRAFNEAIDADGYDTSYEIIEKAIRSALASAAPFVNPLEWNDVGLSWLKAESPLGVYTVEPNGTWHFEQIGEELRFTSADAKAAQKDAEAHHVARASSLFASPPPQTNLQVKPLEWMECTSPKGSWVAVSVAGDYVIRERSGDVRLSLPEASGWTRYPSHVEAKAAAQASYERRLMSAFAAPPQANLMGAELLTTIKEFARWHHLNEATIAAGKKPSDSEIDFEATAWNRITTALATEGL